MSIVARPDLELLKTRRRRPLRARRIQGIQRAL